MDNISDNALSTCYFWPSEMGSIWIFGFWSWSCLAAAEESAVNSPLGKGCFVFLLRRKLTSTFFI